MTPPWLPLAIAIVLLGVVGFLYWSLQRNLKRIDFDDRPTAEHSSTPSSGS